MKRFGAAYLDSFGDYVRDPCEVTLRNAYELGRDAVQRGLSVLDLAIAHHDALVSVLRTVEGKEDERIVRAAGEFLLESISTFEMVQRGFREAREAAMLEQRHAETLRQLSHFLTDASLALDASNSLDEMLRLVAEQARELIPADCCLVAMASDEKLRVRAVSHPEDDLRWTVFARWADLSRVGEAVQLTGWSMRIRGDDVATYVRVPGGASAADLVLRDWLVSPLTALDRRVIGSIHLLAESAEKFTGLHEAVLVHLAQMAAAAIERAQLYN